MGAYSFFKGIQNDLSHLKVEVAQKVVAVELENFVTENFEKQGFQGANFQAWAKRKTPDPKNGSRAILVKSTALRDAATVAKVRNNIVTVNIPLDYAQVHNEGGKAGRGAGFTMPKRQFIGESDILTKRFNEKAKRLMDAKFRK
jgi:phage gpG-like protein